MHEKEMALILKYIPENAVMLEWGSGGSTFYFSKRARKYFSIEHNEKWGKTVQARVGWNEFWAKLLTGRKERKVEYHIVKPNAAAPALPSKIEDYRDYVDQVDRLGVPRFDIVLIDGRARDHCAEKILKYIDGSSIVFIHDFFMPGREYYGRVLEMYDVVDSVKDTPQTLVALRKK
jgi:hypothetical protein